MHARVIRIKGNPERVDEGVENFKSQAAPTAKAQPGYAGIRLLVNRDTGDAVVVGFWQDEEALRRSGEALRELRADASSRFGAEAPTLSHYEAAIQHRPKPTEAGNWVRLSTLRGDASKVDEGIRNFETEVIPAVEKLDGFRAAILLVDRGTGEAMVATVWDSKEDLERSASEALPLRARAADVVGATGTPLVESYEVAFAELLAPVPS